MDTTRNAVLAGLFGLMVVIGLGIGTGLASVTGLDSMNLSASKTKTLSDGEIAMIAVVAGEIDVRYAHLALAISSNAEVKKFAKTMIRDHPAVTAAAGAVLGQIGVEPVESDLSRQLQTQAQELIDELSGLRGAEFDRRYAENELAYHEFVNGALREQFIPGAQSEEFREALKGALVVFEGHEQLARDMVESVSRSAD